MMRSWVIILLGFGLGVPAIFAQQNEIPKHAVSLEFLGTGIAYSFNYEYYFHRNPFFRCAGRVGFNYLRFQNQGDNIGGSVVPISINTVYFEGKHHFELDLGIMAYGFAYFLVHDVIIHQRFKWFTRSNNTYVRAIRWAHKMHHKRLGKEDGESFGMLYVHKIYWNKILRDKKLMGGTARVEYAPQND